MQPRILGLLLGLIGGVRAIYDFGPDCPHFNITAKAPKRVRPGQTLTYAIRVTNRGQQAIEQLFIEAQLPDYMEFPVPPKVGRAPKPSFTVWPKSITYETVSRPLGNGIVLENVRRSLTRLRKREQYGLTDHPFITHPQVTLPARKSVTFKIYSRARDCVPASDRLVFEAVAYLFRDLAQDCFLHARPSNVTAVKTGNKGSDDCPAGVGFAILGLDGFNPIGGSDVGLLPSLALAPEAPFAETNTPAQEAVRAELRTGRTAWRRSANVGTDGAVDPVVQSLGGIQAANTLTTEYEVRNHKDRAVALPGGHSCSCVY